MSLHEKTVRKLELFFGAVSSEKLSRIPPNYYLTPDHAVYMNLKGNLSTKQTLAVSEIRIFARQVLALIQKKGWKPVWLTKQDVRFLLNMKEEKYRQAIWKNK